MMTTVFLAWGNKDAAVSDNIPNRFFSSVEVMVQALHIDGSLEEHTVAANADFPEFMQVYRIANRMSEWSSRQRNSATAVVYNKSCKVLAPPDANVVEKPFYLFTTSDDEPKESETYCWTDIPDKVLIRDKFGVEKWLYNRSGGYEIEIHRYDDVICYDSTGMVKYIYRADSDSEWQEDKLPLLIGIKNLRIRKYIQDADTFEYVSPEKLSFRQNGLIYKDARSLTEGSVDLLITLQGKERIVKVWYLPYEPYEGDEAPIKRNFANKEIRFFDGSNIQVSSDELIIDIVRGSELEKIIIPIYSPIEGHEIWIDGTLVERISINDEVQIPFLNCDHFTVKTIDRHGIKTTTGEDLREGYYSAPDQGTGDVVLRNTVGINDLTLYIFNPQSKTKMKKVAGGVELPIYSEKYPRHYGDPKFVKSSPFAKIKGISLIEAFETAIAERTYFFVFKELKKGVKDERLVDDLFIPLAKQNKLDHDTINQLWRFAFEFHFDWMLLPRSLWEAVPANLRDKVEDFFLSTPKATNEYEHRQLEIFVDSYWDFNDFSTEERVGKTALKLILGQSGDTPKARHETMTNIIRDYDHSTVKFHEMTKTIKK